jgi:predicted acyl esterase
MRLRPALLLVVAALASVLAVPATATQWVEERVYVPTPHGELHVLLTRPVTGRVPVLLTLRPDRTTEGATTEGFAIDAYRDRYTRRGYARAIADLHGTGWSGGCWDYGGRAGAEAHAALVEWLGTRTWSNGRVGLIGMWGTLEVAALAPPHLAAVVPQDAVSSWYGLSYDHAVTQFTTDHQNETARYFEGSTATYFHTVGATPPLLYGTPVSGQLVRHQAERLCPEVAEHLAHAHSTDPAYDDFWRERDWALRAHRVRAPVLFQHGWVDVAGRAAQFTRYWQNLPASPDHRAIVGQWHDFDVFLRRQDALPGFPVHPLTYLDLFLARHLKGEAASRLDQLPRVLSGGSDHRFRTTLPLDVRPTTWRLGEPMPGGTGSFVNTGTESSAVFKRDVARQAGYAAFAWTVSRDTRLVGSAEVTLRLTSSARRGQVAVTLLDVAPGAEGGTAVTRGLLDLRYRRSLAAPEDVPVLQPFTARVTLRPQDHVLKRGHRLVVAVAGSDSVWGVPDPLVGQFVTVLPGSSVRLPLADPADGLV